jgi:hypothetical protein
LIDDDTEQDHGAGNREQRDTNPREECRDYGSMAPLPLAAESLGYEFDPAPDIVGCPGVGDVGMLRGEMVQDDRDDLIVT